MALAQSKNSTNKHNGEGRVEVGESGRANSPDHFVLFLFLFLAAFSAQAQTARPIISDFNAIGWYVYQGDHKLGSKWEIHTEYQARRTHFITDWQQSLLRGGLAFKPMERLRIGGGYTWLVTHPYGQHPVANLGTYPEHRFYEDISLSDEVGYMQLSHRLRLEQRYIGIPEASGPLSNPDVWNRQNRIRYQLTLDFPLQGPTIDDHEWYATAFDEVFLSFGRSVSSDAFNQNRVALGFGYRFTEDFKLELQYLNQILQNPDPDAATGLPVFEFNNGFRVGLIYNLTLIESNERDKGGPDEQ
jgi:hypothetical protein